MIKARNDYKVRPIQQAIVVIGGVAAVIAIVVAAIACRGNKKESELKTPLLQSKKKLLF